jgi:Fe-S oxidoreductase
MHFAKHVYHNPMYPAVDIEVTRGCTHNKCAFCTMYQEEPFRVTPIEIFQEDLRELALYYPKVTKMQWLGGNPFALSADKLKERAALCYKQFPELQHIGMFSCITDIMTKTDEELRELRALNIELFIGQESGDDWTLNFVNKGFTSTDILEQSARLDAAGFTYGATFLGGLAPIEHSEDHAVHTAEVFNKLHPAWVGTGSLALFPGSKMSKWRDEGKFMPLTELELMKELRLFLSILNIPCALTAHHSSALSIMGPFPKNKAQMLAKLDFAIEHYDEYEDEMNWHRNHITHM